MPRLLTGAATVREWFDEDRGRIRIEVRVISRRFAPLFGCQAPFTPRHVEAVDIPSTVKPRREEASC